MKYTLKTLNLDLAIVVVWFFETSTKIIFPGISMGMTNIIKKNDNKSFCLSFILKQIILSILYIKILNNLILCIYFLDDYSTSFFKIKNKLNSIDFKEKFW